MKTKLLLFALSFSLLLLGGCVAAVGPEYGGYYPPARPYYGYARPYYAPRPVIVVPVRPYYGGGYHGGYGGGGYHGGGGHGRGH